MAEPFLSYLTVFKSRLAISNLVLPITSFGHQPTETLLRKLRRVAESRKDLELRDPESSRVLGYLLDKRVVSAESRSKGRYRGYQLERRSGEWAAVDRNGTQLEAMPVFLVDIWMSDEALPSTVGAPTPDNVQEVLELAFQIRLLSRAKNTWTSAGHMVRQLRDYPLGIATEESNPFVLGLEATGLLRQVLDTDGLVVREVLRELVGMGGSVTRDEVAQHFAHIIDRALEVGKKLGMAPPETRKLREFAALIHKTSEKRSSASTAPGVLEHRVSPRLEWLTDFGYLSKAGLPKNGFEYIVEPLANDLLIQLDANFGTEFGADSVAVWDWRNNPRWHRLRSSIATADASSRVRSAYRALRRQVGPAALREVAFIAALLSEQELLYVESVEALIEFAKATDGASLSGGRYRRAPENIYIPDRTLEMG